MLPILMMFIAIFTNEVTDAISVSIDAEYDVLAYNGAIFSEIGITANFGNDELSIENILAVGAANSVFNDAYVGISRDAVSLLHLILPLRMYWKIIFPSARIVNSVHYCTHLFAMQLRGQIMLPSELSFRTNSKSL